MQQTMIRWKLKECMARYDIKGTELSRELGMTRTHISRMRNRMPELDERRLNNLCNAISKLGGTTIKLEELVDYSSDGQIEN